MATRGGAKGTGSLLQPEGWMYRPPSMRFAVLGVALAAVFAAVGCGGRAGPGAAPGDAANPGDTAAVRGQRFIAKAIMEQGTPHELVAGTSIELWFTDDGRLVVRAGCNTMSGAVSMAGGTLDVADLSITEMGCDPPRHEQDQRLATFLAGKPSWRLDGKNLVLSSAGTELVLTPRETRPLVGTTWKVDTLIQGEVASSTPVGVEATAVFGDGEATVSGLCNLRAVKYRATDSTIVFELGPLTRMACAPGIMTVENAAVALLDGQTTYRLDADTLTITKGGRGLRFVAQD